LIAGPIVKARDFLPQIVPKYLKEINREKVFKDLVLGYFLKMVVADNLKDFTFWIEYPYFQEYKTIDLIMMLFGYSSQIFADFAGYSLIAIGLAGLFGYQLRDNFNFPYIASSFKDFWKRWHISLSSFLMEYLYFPLGGSKKGKARTYINLFIVMALGGLWHGAAWSYMIWGFTHGLFLAMERFIFDKFKINPSRFNNIFYSFFVFTVVTFAWLLFKLPDFSHVLLYIKTIFTNASFSFSKTLFLNIFIFSLPVYIYHFRKIFTSISKQKTVDYRYVAYAIMIFLIISNSGTSGAFIYFQF
jgi:alginate O-acetyltransferase complex protein AlgI